MPGSFLTVDWQNLGKERFGRILVAGLGIAPAPFDIVGGSIVVVVVSYRRWADCTSIVVLLAIVGDTSRTVVLRSIDD